MAPAVHIALILELTLVFVFNPDMIWKDQATGNVLFLAGVEELNVYVSPHLWIDS